MSGLHPNERNRLVPRDPGDVVAELEARLALLERARPEVAPGRISATIAATPDPGHLFLQGQSIAGADVKHPALWAVVPASWKSGTTLNLPDARGRDLFGTGAGGVAALGALGGSNTVTLTAANLPPHGHDMTHNHGGSTGNDTPDHAHWVSGNTGGQSNDHSHGQSVTANPGTGGTGIRQDYDSDGSGLSPYPQGVNTGGVSADHSHGMAFWSQGASARHTHPITQHSGNTGNGPGTSTAVSTLPAHLGVNWQISGA